MVWPIASEGQKRSTDAGCERCVCEFAPSGARTWTPTGTLDHSPFEGDHSGVDIIAKRAVEYVSPNENSDTRLPVITTGKRTGRSPRLGPTPFGPGFATGHGGVCPMRVGRFKAYFGSRISARRRASPPVPAIALPRNTHHNRTIETQPPNGIRCSASAHDE